jgi:hypothetical protein
MLLALDHDCPEGHDGHEDGYAEELHLLPHRGSVAGRA